MNPFGPDYSNFLDGDRLRRQHISIRRLMSDGHWRTLHEIALALGYPEASVSAQLRHLRKPEFGSHTVTKRRRTGGLWEYRVEESHVTFDKDGQGDWYTPPGDSTYRGH